MAFSIEEFKSSTQHGFLKPSNFLVHIATPQCIQRVQDNEALDIPNLIYLTAAASLPGMQILTTENKIYGQGPTVKMPYDIGVTDITLKFYVDAGSKSMVYFYNWLRNVVNLSHRQDEARQGALRFSVLPEEKVFLAPKQKASIPPLVDLPKLLSAAERFAADNESEADLKLLLAPGSSLGGARPKASVRDKD